MFIIIFQDYASTQYVYIEITQGILPCYQRQKI